MARARRREAERQRGERVRLSECTVYRYSLGLPLGMASRQGDRSVLFDRGGEVDSAGAPAHTCT